MTRNRGGASRTLALSALAALALTAAGTAAYAADVDPQKVANPPLVYGGAGAGYDGVIDGRAAGYNHVSVGDTLIRTYCLEYNVPAATSGEFTLASWSDSGIANLDKASAIAALSGSIGTPLTDPDLEASAVQVAIWSLTDGVAITDVPNPDLVTRAQELVAAGITLDEPQASAVKFNISATTQVAQSPVSGQDEIQVTIVATDDAGDPVAHQHIATYLGTDDPTYLVTDGDGEVEQWFGLDQIEDILHVAAAIAVQPGQVLIPEGDHQIVVVGQSTVGYAMGDVVNVPLRPTEPVVEEPVVEEPVVEEPVVETPVVEEPPVVAEPVTPDPAPEAVQEKPSELPFTGAMTSAGVVLALAALGIGSGVWAWRLHRRAA